MGFTYIEVVVKGGKASQAINMLVDTGLLYTTLSPQLIAELGLHPTPYKVKLTLADKRAIEARLFLAEVEVRGSTSRRGLAS